MELKDTVKMMNSSDYKERFKAEYAQVVIRYQKLKAMLYKWDNGELNFQPTCPRSTYNMQIKAMTDLIAVLEARAVMEGVDLELKKPDEPVKYENLTDFIRKNMDGYHGDFIVAATDMSEKEEGCICVTIYPGEKDGDTADFLIYPDGKEEYTTLL